MRRTSTLAACIFLLFLGVHLVYAAPLVVEKQTIIPIIVAGGEKPATFTLQITNNGQTDNFEIYSLVGITIKPREQFKLETGKTTSLNIEAFPNKRLRKSTRGFVIFNYEIYSSINGVTEDKLLFKLVDLKDVFEIRPMSIKPDDEIATVAIQNRENATFNDVLFSLRSPLFTAEKTLSFKPYETLNISLPVNTEAMKKLLAGTYEATVKIAHEGVAESTTAEIKYLEKSGLSVLEDYSGVIIRKITSQKTNEGNVPIDATIVYKQNILTRLLTRFSTQPDNVSKQGLFVTYTWTEKLSPGESLAVTKTTDYTLPFIILVIIVAIVVFVKIYTMTKVTLTKRVSMVRTRGGEFALKVRLSIKAHTNIENLIITDRIPHAMKLYDNLAVKPDLVDESTRRIVWKFPRLHAGESRVLSYIIYSKIRVVGAFELPLAHASYARDGKTRQMHSNKTSFVSDTLNRED